MRKKFRNIVVDGIGYRWLLCSNDWFLYLLVVMQSAPKATIRVLFDNVRAPFYWYDGLLYAICQGKKMFINLHKPSMIAEIIKQCTKNGESFAHKGYKTIDGIKILEQMGYEILDLDKKENLS